MDVMSLWMGLIGIALGASVVNVSGLDWVQRKLSTRMQQVALSRPLVREFPTSAHTISLDREDKLA